MRGLLFLLIAGLVSCRNEEPSYSTKAIDPNCGYEIDGYYAPEYDTYFQWQFIGDWQQMTLEEHGKTGRWPINKDFTDTARYNFYGHGVGIMTEINPNHSGYQVIIDGTLRAEVITYTDTEIGSDVKTWNTECLTTGNHVLELVRLNDQGAFVLNGTQINFYVEADLQGWNPCYDECLTKPPCETDTIYIEIPIDTVFVYDTLYMPGPPTYLQPKIYVVADSIIYEIE